MAYDKVIDSALLDADLTAVADAIRAKSTEPDSLTFPAGFVEAVGKINVAKAASAENLALASDTVIRDNYRINSTGNMGESSGNSVVSFKNPKAGQECRLVYRGAFVINGNTNLASGSSSSVAGTLISANLNTDSYLNEQGDLCVTIPAEKSLAWIHFSFAGLTSVRFPFITVDGYIGNGGYLPEEE